MAVRLNLFSLLYVTQTIYAGIDSRVNPYSNLLRSFCESLRDSMVRDVLGVCLANSLRKLDRGSRGPTLLLDQRVENI